MKVKTKYNELVGIMNEMLKEQNQNLIEQMDEDDFARTKNVLIAKFQIIAKQKCLD